MLARTTSYTTLGLQALPVHVEVDAARGLPALTIVGLPDQAVREAKERVRSAIANSLYQLPSKRFTVNLAPADLKKAGGVFDLAIALGILAASHQLDPAQLASVIVLGELALDGGVRPIRGTLPIALALRASRRRLIVPAPNAPEASMIVGLSLLPVRSLRDAVELLSGIRPPPPPRPPPPCPASPRAVCELNRYDVDFAEVKGHAHAKRALEIAVAGCHHVLMIGPPGAGKTMLAQRIPTIQPALSLDEALEATAIHSVAGLLVSPAAAPACDRPQAGEPTSSDGGVASGGAASGDVVAGVGIDGWPLLRRRPFRAPHHTSSAAALIGGGPVPKPGEVSLAHHGVLFLDELPEFHRDVLESLRQLLESGEVHVARTKQSAVFPARFLLVAAMNPCCCGWLTDPRHRCRCSSTQIQRYLAKVSGPLLDRIDLHIDVPAVPFEVMTRAPEGESSAAIRARVQQAITFRRKRGQQHQNSQLRTKELKTHCPMTSDVLILLKSAMQDLNLSARSYTKILKIARTIADLAQQEIIQPEHVAEAIQYRSLDRQLWA